MAGQRRRFGGDAFHQVAVADDGVGVMVDDLEARPVEARGQMTLRRSPCPRRWRTLAERPGGGLDARRQAALRVAGRPAAPLAECLSSSSGRS